MSNQIEPICYNFCPKPEDYLIFQCDYSSEQFNTPEKLKQFYHDMADKFCNNTVIVIPMGVKISEYAKDEILSGLKNILKSIEDEQL